MRTPHPALLLLAVVFSGITQAMISAPASWVWLHPLSWVPAFWAFSHLEGGRAFRYGWLCGTAGQAAIFYWLVDTITVFSNLPWAVAILILLAFSGLFGFYVGVFAWGFGRVRRLSGVWWPVAIAAWFCACEYLTPQLFPYFQGVAWYQQPWIFLITALTGVAGVSMLVMLSNAVGLGLLSHFLERRANPESAPSLEAGTRRGAIVLVAALLLSLGYCQLRLRAIDAAEETAPTVRLASIQSNQDVFKRRAMMRSSKTAIADDQVRLLKDTLARDPEIDAFILPEGALQGRPDWPRNLKVRKFVADTGKEIWTGGSSNKKGEDGRRQWFNSAFRLYGDAQTDRRYDKNVLLPFGEYMPGASLFPVLKKIQGVGNYQPGDGIIVFEALEDVKFTFLICYEAILSRYVRRAVKDGANLLVNVSYDAWYGDTACPHQFLMLVVLQSAQNGVPTARSATTGISAFADARGRFLSKSGLFSREALIEDVKLVRMPSLYTAWGDWLAWLCVFAISGLLTVARRRVEPATKWRELWPLAIFLFGAAVTAVIVFGGLGPMG
ncbi:MAG: apolipoprotein N-acyltransferase [Deltaproteobacteria bacterium]|nr:apolipoprotein N-acyltransferase [Deltaproteobacteria bacterium]